MGTLAGHALPGTIFYISGFWNLINALRVLVAGAPFKHRFWYPINVKCTQRPLEPIIRIAACLIGILIEMGHSARWHITDKDGNFINMNDFQHSTMYMTFLIASVVDLLIERRPGLAGLDGFCWSLGFAGEAFLFYFHLGGRPMVDSQIHLCLVVACVMCSVGAIVARWKSSNPIISIVYSLCVMVQGTWFIHAGFLLYPPGMDKPWLNMMDMEAMMYVTDLFLIHFIFGLAFVLAVYSVFTVVITPVLQTKQYVKHPKSEPAMYKTVPTSHSGTHFYMDSD